MWFFCSTTLMTFTHGQHDRTFTKLAFPFGHISHIPLAKTGSSPQQFRKSVGCLFSVGTPVFEELDRSPKAMSPEKKPLVCPPGDETDRCPSLNDLVSDTVHSILLFNLAIRHLIAVSPSDANIGFSIFFGIISAINCLRYFSSTDDSLSWVCSSKLVCLMYSSNQEVHDTVR